jgi:hypothetical protein
MAACTRHAVALGATAVEEDAKAMTSSQPRTMLAIMCKAQVSDANAIFFRM